jgi:hypothetical protein
MIVTNAGWGCMHVLLRLQRSVPDREQIQGCASGDYSSATGSGT